MPQCFVKVTVADGNYWHTTINLDLEGARKYFMGQPFDMGPPDGPENMQKVISVEQVKTAE